MLMVALIWFVLIKSLLMKKYQTVPMCVCLILYEIALYFYSYPVGIFESNPFLAKWLEHILFVLLIVSIFYASTIKAWSCNGKFILPKVLAGVAAFVWTIRVVFAKYVLSEGYSASVEPGKMADVMYYNASISNEMFTIIHWMLIFIMGYYAFKLCKEDSGKEKKADCPGYEESQ